MRALVIVLLVAAVGGPLLLPLDAFSQTAAHRLDAPDLAHLMGRDTFGRDVLARVVLGARTSLTISLASVALGGVLGTVLGLCAAYRRGWTESLLMRAVDIIMSFPSLLVGLLVVAVLGAGVTRLVLALGLVLAPSFARVVHSATLGLNGQEFVVAARSVGASPVRVVSRHVLPNILGETVVLASVLVATALRIEAGLSFIGLGVSPPTPAWGNMIREGAPLLLSAPWVSVWPGLALALSVLVFNLVGDGVRDRLDPHRGTG
jgi:peptide/nickel transport system permease protein